MSRFIFSMTACAAIFFCMSTAMAQHGHAYTHSYGGHVHSTYRPSTHIHGAFIPAHSHGIYIPAHSHGIYIPAHGHGGYIPYSHGGYIPSAYNHGGYRYSGHHHH